jgi:hypothetical protein
MTRSPTRAVKSLSDIWIGVLVLIIIVIIFMFSPMMSGFAPSPSSASNIIPTYTCPSDYKIDSKQPVGSKCRKGKSTVAAKATCASPYIYDASMDKCKQPPPPPPPPTFTSYTDRAFPREAYNYSQIDLEQCKNECLSDAKCKAFMRWGSGNWCGKFEDASGMTSTINNSGSIVYVKST